jgi:hypothetical protein
MTTNDFETQDDLKGLLLPVVLIFTGVLVLAGVDAGLLSLERIKDLWPAAIVLIGLVELVPELHLPHRNRDN